MYFEIIYSMESNPIHTAHSTPKYKESECCNCFDECVNDSLTHLASTLEIIILISRFPYDISMYLNCCRKTSSSSCSRSLTALNIYIYQCVTFAAVYIQLLQFFHELAHMPEYEHHFVNLFYSNCESE